MNRLRCLSGEIHIYARYYSKQWQGRCGAGPVEEGGGLAVEIKQEHKSRGRGYI
ncbi:MAG: hypothetical protein ON057_000447 [Glomeribacter sp. 1016415]|nr:hypothetical protein [Glomeribacter sp. 1016415]